MNDPTVATNPVATNPVATGADAQEELRKLNTMYADEEKEERVVSAFRKTNAEIIAAKMNWKILTAIAVLVIVFPLSFLMLTFIPNAAFGTSLSEKQAINASILLVWIVGFILPLLMAVVNQKGKVLEIFTQLITGTSSWIAMFLYIGFYFTTAISVTSIAATRDKTNYGENNIDFIMYCTASIIITTVAGVIFFYSFAQAGVTEKAKQWMYGVAGIIFALLLVAELALLLGWTTDVSPFVEQASGTQQAKRWYHVSDDGKTWTAVTPLTGMDPDQDQAFYYQYTGNAPGYLVYQVPVTADLGTKTDANITVNFSLTHSHPLYKPSVFWAPETFTADTTLLSTKNVNTSLVTTAAETRVALCVVEHEVLVTTPTTYRYRMSLDKVSYQSQ